MNFFVFEKNLYFSAGRETSPLQQFEAADGDRILDTGGGIHI